MQYSIHDILIETTIYRKLVGYVWLNMNIGKAYSSLMSYLIRKTAEDYRYQPTISSMLFLWSLNQYAHETNMTMK